MRIIGRQRVATPFCDYRCFVVVVVVAVAAAAAAVAAAAAAAVVAVVVVAAAAAVVAVATPSVLSSNNPWTAVTTFRAQTTESYVRNIHVILRQMGRRKA